MLADPRGGKLGSQINLVSPTVDLAKPQIVMFAAFMNTPTNDLISEIQVFRRTFDGLQQVSHIKMY